jgi:hypothetical protein
MLSNLTNLYHDYYFRKDEKTLKPQISRLPLRAVEEKRSDWKLCDDESQVLRVCTIGKSDNDRLKLDKILVKSTGCAAERSTDSKFVAVSYCWTYEMSMEVQQAAGQLAATDGML